MSDQFVAEIRMFPFNFAPKGWSFCNGQLLQISSNTALFSLLGTTYGGDGRSTFGLPNLQGRVPMHTGQGPGLSNHVEGETGGADTITLQPSEMPIHSHVFQATPSSRFGGGESSAQGNYISGGTGTSKIYATGTPTVQMSAAELTLQGGGQPHNNLMPYLTLNFCIATAGIFPAR